MEITGERRAKDRGRVDVSQQRGIVNAQHLDRSRARRTPL
jgi:hypothetical protein